MRRCDPSGEQENNVLTEYISVERCKENEWHCGGGMCLPIQMRCDGVPQCPDLSDEYLCRSRCDRTEFQCGDGACIDPRLVCDGYQDCLDYSDETNCRGNPFLAFVRLGLLSLSLRWLFVL